MKQFKDIETFYDHVPDRRFSEEADYGVHWRLAHPSERFRVSYIRATGELYQVATGGRGPVVLLGTFPVDVIDQDAGDDWRQPWYKGLNGHLQEGTPEGWEHQCTKPNSLLWLLERLQEPPARRVFADEYCEACRLGRGIASECVMDHDHGEDPDSCLWEYFYCTCLEGREAQARQVLDYMEEGPHTNQYPG